MCWQPWREESFREFIARQRLGAFEQNIDVLYCDADPTRAELPTLEALHQFVQQQSAECLIYYLHTKGITWPCPKSQDWRALLEHFTLLRYDECMAALGTHEVCGVNWNTTPSRHFSGNFWWARGSYLALRPQLAEVADVLTQQEYSSRHAAEFWLSWGRQPHVAAFHKSHIDHYVHTYPRSRYANLREVVLSDAFHNRSAWQGLENRFQDLLEVVGTIRTIVEIGVDFGYSLFCLASAAPQARVIGVDPYHRLSTQEQERLSQLGRQAIVGSPKAEQWVRERMSRFPRVELVTTTSAEFASTFTDRVDVIHLDGVHTLEGVRNDFELWESKLRPGGCILFHDILAFPDDVGYFFESLPGRKARLLEGAGLGAWYKSAEPAKEQREVIGECQVTAH